MMDRLIRKVGVFLTCLFSLFFLAFLAEILYVFLSRRGFFHRFKRQPSGRVLDPTGSDHHQATRVTNRSQSAIPVEELVKLQTYARLLSTIKEEEGVDREIDRHVTGGGGEISKPEQGNDETAFESPCGSPVAYFTPNASPHV